MRLRRMLLAMLMLAGLHLVAAVPAAACSCTSGPGGESAMREQADAVFVGELVRYTPPPKQATVISSDPAVWTFAVTAVYKGEVAATQDLVSPSSGSPCGLELPHSGTFVVFTSAPQPLMSGVGGQPLYAFLCSGTRSLADSPLPPDWGAGKPPLPGIRTADVPRPRQQASEPHSPPSPTGAPAAVAVGPRARRSPDLAAVAAVAIASTALFVAGVALRRRKHATPPP